MDILESFANLYNTLKAKGLDVNYPAIRMTRRDFSILETVMKAEVGHLYPFNGKEGEMMIHGFRIINDLRETDN